MAGQYFGTLGYDKAPGMFEGVGDAFSQAYLQKKQLLAQREMEKAKMAQQQQFHAEELAAELKAKADDLELRKKQFMLEKSLAKDKREQAKLERVVTSIDVIKKGLNYGMTLLKSNPNILREEFDLKMKPVADLLINHAGVKEASLLLSKEQAQKELEAQKTLVMSKQAALEAGRVPEGTQIIDDTGDKERKVTAADVAAVEKNFPKKSWGFIPNKENISVNEQVKAKYREQLLNDIAPAAKESGTVVMVNPDGKRFAVPVANVDKATAKGWKVAK